MAVTETRTGAIYGIGVYATDTFGVSNSSLAVDDSLVGTTGIGSVVVTADAPVSVTGVSATSSVGDIEVDINIVAYWDSFLVSASIGSVTVTADNNVEVSGVSATSAVGTLPTPDSVYDVVGVEGTGTVNGGYTDKYDGFLAYGNTTNAIYGEGVYGTSRYGYVDSSIYHEVDDVSATGSVGFVSISAASETSLSASVVGEIITDAPAVIGDEVTVTADANTALPSVVGTSAVTTVTTRTTNVFTVSGLEATSAVNDVVVVAEANISLASVSGTSAVTTVTTTADSNTAVTGVSATGTIDENEVVRNNAIPTFTGVSATGAVTTVSVTTVRNVFQASDRNENRTVYIAAEKPRIVYIPQDKPRTVYVRAA